MVQILSFKIYEIINGIELYKQDEDFFVGYGDWSDSTSTANDYTNVSTPLMLTGGTGANFFYNSDTLQNPFPVAMFPPGKVKLKDASSFWGGLGSTTNYRFHLKSDDGKNRAIDVSFQFHADSSNRKIVNILYGDLYLDGTNLGSSSIGFGESLLNEYDSPYWMQWIGTFPWINNQRDAIISFSLHAKYRQNDSISYGGARGYSHLNDAAKTRWETFLNGYAPVLPDSDNPYWDGGVSGTGGGNGNFSEDSDTPEADIMPGLSAVGTGFATIFTPSASQLRDLSGLFWNSNVFTFLQNLVENITDMFTSLAMVPFDVEDGRTVSVTWLGIDTAVTLTLASQQYYEFNMGSINMADDTRIFTSGSVLDYSPFSKLGIYLPFIGYQDLDIDECRNAVINLRYRIDILSGACVAIIKVDGRDLYQFTGNCLTQIPITNESMQSLVSDAVNVGIAASGVGSAAATSGAGLAEAAGTKEGVTATDAAKAHSTIQRAESSLASASANSVIGSKPSYNKSGAVSSSAAMMSIKQPYLFLSTPRQSIPDHYQRYNGFPSNITSKLGNLRGYTVVEDIRLNGLVATSPEVAEIYDLLRKGVII